MSRRRLTPEERRARLLAELAEVLGLALEPGTSLIASLGDGRVVAELRIDIRRASSNAEQEDWREEALKRLRADPHRLARCMCDTRRKLAPWLTWPEQCSRRVTAAVAFRAHQQPLGVGFVWCCDQHASSGAGIQPALLLHRFTFWPHELAEIRELAGHSSAGGAA